MVKEQQTSLIHVESRDENKRGAGRGKGHLGGKVKRGDEHKVLRWQPLLGGISYGGDCQVWGRGGVICMRG